MQDRFKSRVWDKTTSTMHYNDFVITATGYVAKLEDLPEVARKRGIKLNAGVFLINQTNIDFDKNCTVMLSTGLSDKNGKEIYDGDILNLYVSSKKLYRYQVKYEIGSFMLVSQDEIFDFKNVWNDNVYPLSQLYFEYQNEENCIDQCEVVGNIYENPELLEVGILA